MGTRLPENLCAHRKGAIEDLIKGLARDTAAQLQILFGKPTGDLDEAEELLVKEFTSFTESLSHVSLSSCEDCECEVRQVPNQVRSPINDQRSVDSGEICRRPAAKDRRGFFFGKIKDRRGCYKRRKTSEMRVEVSTTNEDGYAWTKYGQKDNLKGQFPTCYLRCTHKFDQGCQATKQVQRIQEAPHMSRTTYFGHRTCRSYSLNNASQNPLLEAHLLSFSSKPITTQDSESHPPSFSSKRISNQYTSSRPSSASFMRSVSSETISTQYTSSCPSSASSVRSFSSETSSPQYTTSSASSVRSFSSDTISPQYASSCPSSASSASYVRSFSSETISPQYTSSCPSSASSVWSFSSETSSPQYTTSSASSASSVRSFSSETISPQYTSSCPSSASPASSVRSFSSETISTQYTSSCPSSASFVRKECGEESREIVRSNSLARVIVAVEESQVSKPPRDFSNEGASDFCFKARESHNIGSQIPILKTYQVKSGCLRI